MHHHRNNLAVIVVMQLNQLKVYKSQYKQYLLQIDSDEDQNIAIKMKQLQGSFPILKKLHPFMMTRQKIIHFMKDYNFRQRVIDRLMQKGILYSLPIVKVQLYSIRYNAVLKDEFDYHDVIDTFEKFGKISNLYADKFFAYVQFDDFVTAYIVIKTLNDFQLEGQTLRLSVKWCENQDQLKQAKMLFMINKRTTENIQLQNNKSNASNSKFMCKYEFYIDLHPEFKLSQKIIGPKGINLKRIIENVLCQQYHAPSIANTKYQKLIKLRLRGKGSGFKQGPNCLQSQQRLNLCVSSKQEKIYLNVCREVEQLLLKVFQDYKIFVQFQSKQMMDEIVYKKLQANNHNHIFQIVKQLNLKELDNIFEVFTPASIKKITQKEILQIIHHRQEARKFGRFKQADDMRNYLKRHGVCLIDEKHAKNKNKKTSWKYLTQ